MDLSTETTRQMLALVSRMSYNTYMDQISVEVEAILQRKLEQPERFKVKCLVLAGMVNPYDIVQAIKSW